MDQTSLNAHLTAFISKSPTPFHATEIIKETLSNHHFTLLAEGKRWNIKPGSRCTVIRNGAVIAFSLGKNASLTDGFRIIGAHTDSPSLQLKPSPRRDTAPYLVTGVEKYGGALLASWFDRELSLAGRVVVEDENKHIISLLIDFERPVLYIPSLAIHLNHNANEENEINVQKHLSPILSQEFTDKHDLSAAILKQTADQHPDTSPSRLIGFDLFCYDPSPPVHFGLNDEFYSAPRLDNLLSCFIGTKNIIESNDTTNTMLICTNHEEIGSLSESGAMGNFLPSVISRLASDSEELGICTHNSFMLSLDNAHAEHPNYKDKSDPDHPILLNTGPVIKLNASQRYSSTSLTASTLRTVAVAAGITTQDFVMRSDMPCGSTIGPLSSSQIGVPSVDIGVPTWGMHSIREATGSRDPLLAFQLVSAFLSTPQLPLHSGR